MPAWSSAMAAWPRLGRGAAAAGPTWIFGPHFVFPGLVDVHAHVPQLPVCGVHPGSLLEWLSRWTFPLERRFRGARARALSRQYFREMLAQGTTTAALYTSAWPDSVESCFEEAASLGLHAWIGPPLMDDGRLPAGHHAARARRGAGAGAPRFARACASP